MKAYPLFIAVLAATLASPAALAESPKPKTATQAQTNKPNVEEFDKQYAQMQERMAQMQEQMVKIRQTTDPQERQKLLQQHWTSMQESMELMNGMWPRGGMGRGMMGGSGPGRGGMMGNGGPGMMGAGPMMDWQQMHDYYSKLTPQQAQQRQYMVDQYMGMQQQMMNHMMLRQQYGQNPGTPPASK